jgi:hypothetical protein
VVGGWHNEVASFLALARAQVAVGGQFEIFGVRDSEDIGLLVSFSGLYLVSLHKHFDFQTEVSSLIGAHPQEVEPMFLVHGVLHEEPIFLLHLEELVEARIVCQSDSLLKLLL